MFSESSTLHVMLCQSWPVKPPEMLLTRTSHNTGHAGLGTAGAELALGANNLSIMGAVPSTAWECWGGDGGQHPSMVSS